jgi:hypothetical protein|nr:hypothetical protein [uncultured Oscillibacter sp.]
MSQIDARKHKILCLRVFFVLRQPNDYLSNVRLKNIFLDKKREKLRAFCEFQAKKILAISLAFAYTKNTGGEKWVIWVLGAIKTHRIPKRGEKGGGFPWRDCWENLTTASTRKAVW